MKNVNSNLIYTTSVVIWICVIVNSASGNVQSKVRCSKDGMEVDIVRSSPLATIYLENLKNYPDEACKPKLSDGVATFHLSLLEDGMSRCGLTRVINIVTGQKVYYHRIIVEEPDDSSKHTFTVKCVITEVNLSPQQRVSSGINSLSNQTVIVKRRSLPENFTEAEILVINGDIAPGSAPVPILGVGVRQGSTLVTGELNVSPGTPLQMEINLDSVSAPVYGILVTYMQVTDTKNQEETIIFNGCSVDPYLFENFNTVDGDFLNAKFRAFKFPESTYVQFRATVNICLDKCGGMECSNGQVGFGRRRRSITTPNGNKNNLFEVTTSTIIKVDFDENTKMDEDLLKLIRTGKSIINEDNNNSKPIGEVIEVREQFKYTVITTPSKASDIKLGGSIFLVIVLCLFQVL